MKKYVLVLLTALLVAGCEKPIVGDVEYDDDDDVIEAGVNTKKFKFTVKGDFSSPVFQGDGVMRAAEYMYADGRAMTDLWVFDFMNGECVQTVHQQPDDDGWGVPAMSLQLGEHHVYFVASRGGNPVVNATTKSITWERPSDTFWKDYEVNVVSTSNGNRAVTLDRIVTKLKVTVTDEVPAGCTSLVLTPETWYHSLNYQTGAVGGSQAEAHAVSVPAAYVGTSGQLAVSLFCLSGATEWTTDITVQAKNTGGDVLGAATITDAPFLRNRSTEYSGTLFSSSSNTMDVGLETTWGTPHVGTF